MTADGQVRHAFPAYKVYIFGADVTEDVLEISVKNHTGKSPNICTVTLANELDKYIMTTKDMFNFFGPDVYESMYQKYFKLIEKEGAEAADKAYATGQIAETEVLSRLENIYPAIKRQVLLSKIDAKIPGIKQPDVAGKDNTHIRQLTGNAFRYPFQAEDPIFHAEDPIRVFLRDPFNPAKWYHGFTGFLSDFDDHVDENNQRILTITAEGPLKILRYARMATNPGIVDVSAVAEMEDAATDRSFWNEGFYDITLPEYMFALIFGNDPENKLGGKFSIKNKSADGHENASQIRFGAAGHFNYARSAVVEYGPPSAAPDSFDIGATPIVKVGTLAEYQSIIDHELKELDLYDLLDENIHGREEIDNYLGNIPRRSDGSADPYSLMDYLGMRTDLYPPDSGALIMLIPNTFHPESNRNFLMKELINSPAMETTFRSRMSMIYDTIERIEFVFYESPKGDLICEFPLYDFDPDDFGFDEVPQNRIVGDSDSASRSVEPRSYQKCGPFANKYIVAKRDTYNFSKSVTDEKVKTQVTCMWNFIPGGQAGKSGGILKPATVTLRHLASLYGYRLEQADPKGHISSKEAAYAYAHITLNKLNADARSLGINAVPNLGMWLNRPIYFLPRNCIGTLTSVTHSIKWGMSGSMDTRLNINYIRGWDGLLNSKTNEPIFTSIGGIPSRPLNYKLLFNLNEEIPSGNATPSGDVPAEKK